MSRWADCHGILNYCIRSCLREVMANYRRWSSAITKNVCILLVDENISMLWANLPSLDRNSGNKVTHKDNVSHIISYIWRTYGSIFPGREIGATNIVKVGTKTTSVYQCFGTWIFFLKLRLIRLGYWTLNMVFLNYFLMYKASKTAFFYSIFVQN